MADRLILLNNDREKEINIFIHGYTQSSLELDQLMSVVNSLELRGAVYLLYWDSGKIHVPRPVITTISVAGHLKKIVSITNPVSFGTMIAGDAVLHGIIQIRDYFNARGKAEHLGQNLLRRLSHIPNGKKYPINLIGYSLGARVIHYALAHSDFSEYNLQDIVLLAGASPAAAEEWYSYDEEFRGPVDEVAGNIYIIYILKTTIGCD